MTPNPIINAQVQMFLNEMLDEKLLPFVLTVGKITKTEDHYTVFFYDSRMHPAMIPLNQDHMLRDAVRAAVLDQVGRMSGPLRSKKAA